MKISVFLVIMVVGCAFAFEVEKELIRELLEHLETRQSIFSGGEDEVREAYETVRDDDNDITWFALKYDGRQLASPITGSDYADFLALCGGDDRVYGYVRVETGDEMNPRAKFAFITWIGPSVSPLKKARVSTDKAFVKAITTQFGKEILADELDELRYDRVKAILEKASGAAYGTGA
ncbi:coactosin-like protein isoform X2 [Patiria miniata]|uniref:Coactosin-like protein n=1 Tax=Patiria miniata TaxID=46514 RepID=A0A914B3Q0_PATMI|nr:coactosin-like protein isoform X2 [Patiria miniata]